MPIVQLARHIGRSMAGCRLRVSVHLVRWDLGPGTPTDGEADGAAPPGATAVFGFLRGITVARFDR